ncbi:hypothetical protein K450DRAFT_250133 [Umbelopsis ramanniana AG]|uniref:DBF4-type domain-containing protein n=1 Tax=Umbelopsis ramanniana AG TaxID=1314678 RepID=A0AAD5HCS0_UMBRA|nr:uncharacterized protein K450DRAFT_250133 [Umbelopsis ramanniana AG]KAI8577816.1 hypothetical protein K450DRAFT_250133 [Umbelopsis ramanniana AG]
MSTVGNLHNLDQQVESTPKASNPVFQPRCNRTPLSQLNKSEHVWRDSRTYARSAIQALELKKQQQQENMQRSRNPPAAAAKPSLHGEDKWVKAYTKAFPTFKIYFDGMENSTRKRLEEKVKLLGSSVEQFFSAKCTHIVTGRPVPDEVKAATARKMADVGTEAKNQENIPDNENGEFFGQTRMQRSSKPALTLKKADNVSRDGDIFEIAHKHKIKIWSVDKLQNRILPLLFDGPLQRDLPNDSVAHRPIPQELPRMLQEEKVFGPSTSKRGEHQGPNFVRFSSHYVFVEDVTGSYRPIVVKEYPKTEQSKTTPSWPILRRNKPGRSPFMKEHSSDNRDPEPEKKAEAAEEVSSKATSNASRKPLAVHKPSASLRALNSQQVEKLEDGNSAQADTRASIGMPSFSASGIHQFGTSRIVSTSGSAVHGLPQPLPPTENINRLDRRVVNNAKPSVASSHITTKPVPGDQSVAAQGAKLRNAKRHKGASGKRRPPPKNYCENCQQRFYNLKQHIKDPKHQEYAKNADNFADLDKIIELTRRRYKVEYSSSKTDERSEVIDGPLPERQAQESQEPEPSSSFVVDDSWEKFADIVW